VKTPYGLQLVDDCSHCRLEKTSGHFCSLPGRVLEPLSKASHQSTYPSGSRLFTEGQSPRGAYILCSGRVKLSTTSREGKVLIVKLAEAGEVLGLSAVVSGTPYEVSAESSGPCLVRFVERESLLRLLSQHGELGLRAAQVLSIQFQAAYRDIHDLVLARSSVGKVAKLLLSWSSEHEGRCVESRIMSNLTHEELGQMIGASRETVTRVLSHLKRKEVIRVEGSTVVIRNRTALEAMIA
jgi:CRP/FNR family transcriptional regulator, cyclic AMP receptor protein